MFDQNTYAANKVTNSVAITNNHDGTYTIFYTNSNEDGSQVSSSQLVSLSSLQSQLVTFQTNITNLQQVIADVSSVQ